MGQAKIVVQVVEGQLLASPHLAFAQGRHPPAHRSHLRADREIGALEKGRVDLPPLGCQDLLDPRQGAEPHARTHCH